MSMRKIREVLRLTHELGLSVRQVREATGVGKTAVSEYVSRARVIGITWPIPPEITDAELEQRLFTPATCPGDRVPPRRGTQGNAQSPFFQVPSTYERTRNLHPSDELI